MRISKREFLRALPIVAASLSAATPTFGHGKGDWNSLSARQKSMKIVSAALATVGKKGGQCKAWVQDVVSAASGRHVSVPLNSAVVTARWAADTSGHVQDLGAAIRSAKPGDAVQMIIRDKYGKEIGHTAFIGSNDGTTIRWIESNYFGDEMVRADRDQTIAKFERAVVGGQYTVYRFT